MRLLPRKGSSAPTARKWLGRHLAQGEAGLADRSSRPLVSPRSISPGTARAILELRRRRRRRPKRALPPALEVSKRTVGRVLCCAGPSRLRDLQICSPPSRPFATSHRHPRDLVHTDTKKLGRIKRIGHRITGNRRESVNGAGWEFLFVAIDERARIGFTELYADDCKRSAVQFLTNTVAYFARLGVRIKRLLTDNGPAFRSKAFARPVGACA